MDSPDKAFRGLMAEIDHVTEDELLEIGHFATTLVVARTKAGIDVDGQPFEKYTDGYAKQRQARGLSTKPDLAVSGHMLGAMVPEMTGPNEVSIRFNNPLEAIKAAVHNNGIDKKVSVKPHSRSVYVNANTGQRVSRDEARKDARRKNKRTKTRDEKVTPHTRHMQEKKREFLDIRMGRELDALANVIGDKIRSRVAKVVE